MGGTKDSMTAGAPRNLTLAEGSLVRSMGPPPAEEPEPLPPPSAPARVVPLTEVSTGPRRFAAAAERAGFIARAVASRGPLQASDGRTHREVDVVSIRCLDARGEVQIAAAWTDGKFDIAFGKRQDGTRRVTHRAADARAWLDHGVEGDIPDMRDAARYVAAALGARLIGVRTVVDGAKTFTCGAIRSEADADDHLRTVHRLPGGTRAQHRELHLSGEATNHGHDRWPLGKPPES